MAPGGTAPRPVVLNNWEATYFDFDHDRIVGIARRAKALGVELFVLDDGWFGRRDRDDSSLGDWVVDRRKLPGGIEALVRDVKAEGLQFGLWIEPEMVNADSDLFRAHPDWAIGVPGRARTESRQQLVLDYARPEVVDHIADALTAVLSSAPIDYVKWDMNRNITEPWTASVPADRQGEFFHRYILGVYELYRRLTERLPGHPVRVVRRRRRALRRRAPRLRPAGLDVGRHRRGGAAGDPVGDVARVPGLVDGRPRLGRAEPPDRAASRRCSPGPPWRCSGRSATSSTRPRCPTRSRPRSPARSPGTPSAASCCSVAGSCACAARSSTAATRPRGWRSTTRGRARSSASTACSGGRCPSAGGSACAGSTRRRPTASPRGWTRSPRRSRRPTARATS